MGKNKSKKQQFPPYNYYRNDGNSLLGISFEENPEQKEFIRLINERHRPIVFCMGDARNWKNFHCFNSSN